MDNNMGTNGQRSDAGRLASTYCDALDAAMVADPLGVRGGQGDWHAMGRGYRATAWRVMGQNLRARGAATGRGGRRVGQALVMGLAVLLGAALHAATAPASTSCQAASAVTAMLAG